MKPSVLAQVALASLMVQGTASKVTTRQPKPEPDFPPLNLRYKILPGYTNPPSDTDHEKLAAAQAKRDRKDAKRAKRITR